MIYTDKYIYNYNYNYSQINTNLHIQIAEEHEERSSNPNTPRKQKDVEIRLADAGEGCTSIDSVSECDDSFLCATCRLNRIDMHLKMEMQQRFEMPPSCSIQMRRETRCQFRIIRSRDASRMLFFLRVPLALQSSHGLQLHNS